MKTNLASEETWTAEVVPKSSRQLSIYIFVGALFHQGNNKKIIVTLDTMDYQEANA